MELKVPQSKYKDRSYNEQSIQKILNTKFKKMKYNISNVYMFGKWETDYFFMDNSMQTWEIEIKVDRQDYERDFQLKPEKHEILSNAYKTESSLGSTLPNYFYFCAPEGVIPRDSLPPYAGLLEVYDQTNIRYVTEVIKIHDEVHDMESILLKKFYYKALRLEELLSNFRLQCYENPEKKDKLLEKFLKTIRF